ncbi:MAG: tripartite tricarboxylate transporter substrate-binding protein, partial [Burkholderiales bacterium]
KVYAAATRKRIAALPGVPTLDELGLKDFEVTVWHGVYAPKGTPKEALDKFAAALRAALKDPMVKTRLTELGVQFVSDAQQSPTGLRDRLAAEIARWTPIIKSAGVYAE